jgi:hypothetical protein
MLPRDRTRTSDLTRRRVGAAGGRARARPAAGQVADPAGPETASPIPTTAPRLDGRRTHVVDRAADYFALADAGLTVAQIARRRRRSKGYVSILVRFGRLLAALPPAERDAMRSPRITWSLAQRLMRADVDAASARAQLRYALGGFATASLGPSAASARRPGAARRAGADDPDAVGDPAVGGPPRLVPRAASPRASVAWGWDADWFARDPAGYAAAHLEHFTHLHRVIAARARAAAATSPDVGQSLRTLGRLLAGQRRSGTSAGAADPVTARALAALEIVGHKLAEAAAAIAALPTQSGAASTGAAPRTPRGDRPPLTLVRPHELGDAVDADLHD